MRKIETILIVEDEPAAARKLCRLVNKVLPDTRILDVIDSVQAGKAWFETQVNPNLVISDIELGDGLSFEIYETLQSCPPIIFLTAFDHYALEAFKTLSVDYLLKPVDEIGLRNALKKLAELDSSSEIRIDQLVEKLSAQNSINRRFLVRSGEHLIALDCNEAAYYFREDRVVIYQATDGKKYPVDSSMEELEQVLNEHRYFRINRHAIVSLDSIRDMIVVSKSRIKLKLDPPEAADFIVSKERSPHFRRWLKGEAT